VFDSPRINIELTVKEYTDRYGRSDFAQVSF